MPKAAGKGLRRLCAFLRIQLRGSQLYNGEGFFSNVGRASRVPGWRSNTAQEARTFIRLVLAVDCGNGSRLALPAVPVWARRMRWAAAT